MQPRQFILAIVVIAACAAAAARVAGEAATTGVRPMSAQHQFGAIDIAYEGLTGLTRIFGAPQTETFTLTPDVHEFRIGLLTLFSAEDLATDPPAVIEATWPVSATDNLTVWYRQAGIGRIYLGHTIWNRGDDF